MPLFIVRHQHDPEHCPAADPYNGANLLNHLSRPSFRKAGLTVHGEAVARGEHTLYMIVEAEHEALVRNYMAPFAMAGSLDVYAASTCAGVASRGGCDAVLPPVDTLVPALDPEEACQQAIEDGLLVHRAHPLNGETSIPALIGGVVMPNAKFYVRNHFQIPKLDLANWRLTVRGLVDRPLNLSWRDLANMRSQSKLVTLECAGNGRSKLEPRVSGEQWNLGAVSTAEWTGVPLEEILNRAGVQPDGRYIVFRGADCGNVEGRSETITFERSLSIDQARESEVLLAYAMNGEALPLQHGFPVRVIVPSWYAVASVKWLTGIEIVDQPFAGYYQADKYHLELETNGRLEREPLTLQRVRSLITEPADDTHVHCGELAMRGVAWSGAAPIANVEIQMNDRPWQQAHLLGEPKRHSWQWWEWITWLDEPGEYFIRSRASDRNGRIQPESPQWNRNGYCNNMIQGVRVQASLAAAV
jgi:DMSO/TMAO reductase YedYZ molybdopterin-dependent catalytic subunit